MAYGFFNPIESIVEILISSRFIIGLSTECCFSCFYYLLNGAVANDC